MTSRTSHPPRCGINIIQANLQHSQAATATLSRVLENNPQTIALIQEPWIRGDKICGLNKTGGKLLLDTTVSKPRACIYLPKHIPTLLINQFCSRNLTAVKFSRSDQHQPDVVLASAYLPGDEDLPLPELSSLAEYCERENLDLITAADTNAHHTLWGNKDTNKRGGDMLNFIFTTNLVLLNQGSEPTFVNSRYQTMIDLTLASTKIAKSITGWHVSKEASSSDHRWIRFCLNIETPIPKPCRLPRKTDKQKFVSLVTASINNLHLPLDNLKITDLDHHTENITSILISSYEQSCPLTTPRSGKGGHWWCASLEKLRHKLRKLFNRAMNTREPTDWERYQNMRKRYKKEIRQRSVESWRRFCTSIESSNQASRVKACLSKGQVSSIGCLKKADNTFTTNDAETSETLLTTHFPGCKLANTEAWVHTNERPTNNQDWKFAQDTVDREKLLWAINTFLPFKAAGLDGVFPGLLKWSSHVIADYLVRILQGCLAHRYIPLKWREVKIIFIPKPGRSDYTQAKAFRPISLTSFLLKTLERLGDRTIRDQVLAQKPLHPNQHAYSEGKSTESALHQVVSHIGGALRSKQPTLGAFIDIEGAFDKTNFNSINKALLDQNVPQTLVEWIDNMLKQRAVQLTVNTTTRAIVGRGCPQGGVLSPLLWNLVVNELITDLNANKLFTVGYADDITILISGPFESSICDRMRQAFKIVETWCAKHELSVNPQKTELVMFTNRRTLGPHKLPKLFATELTLREEVKYLGVILDSKLLWNKHLDHKLNKCAIAFYQCKRMMGDKWGLSPKITLWLYTAVIRPMLAYGALVWWTRTELSTVVTRLRSFQRLACSSISGCMKTTPTAAMEVALNITPLDLHIQQEATITAVRLWHLGLWGKNNDSPHTEILRRILEHQPLITAPCDRIPNQYSFNRKYHIVTQAEEKDFSGVKEVRVYTDGSKTKKGSGAGVHSLELGINIHLPLGKHSSIFQCECIALTTAATVIHKLETEGLHIRFLTDSMAVLKALHRQTTNSTLTSECRTALHKLTNRNTVTLQWIKGHSGSYGNDAADELARRGSSMTVAGPLPLIPIPFSQFRAWTRERFAELHSQRWSKSTDYRQSRTVMPSVNKRLTRRLLNLDRQDLKTMMGTITGHAPLNKHLHTIGMTDSPLCRGCFVTEETAAHVILECEAVAPQRLQILGTVRSLREACESPSKILRFWAELGWLL